MSSHTHSHAHTHRHTHTTPHTHIQIHTLTQTHCTHCSHSHTHTHYLGISLQCRLPWMVTVIGPGSGVGWPSAGPDCRQKAHPPRSVLQSSCPVLDIFPIENRFCSTTYPDYSLPTYFWTGVVYYRWSWREGRCRRNVRIWEELEDAAWRVMLKPTLSALLSLGEPDALMLWLVLAATSWNEPNTGWNRFTHMILFSFHNFLSPINVAF